MKRTLWAAAPYLFASVIEHFSGALCDAGKFQPTGVSTRQRKEVLKLWHHGAAPGSSVENQRRDFGRSSGCFASSRFGFDFFQAVRPVGPNTSRPAARRPVLDRARKWCASERAPISAFPSQIAALDWPRTGSGLCA